MQDATVRINENYGETVPANPQEQMKHETYNGGQGGKDNCSSIVHLNSIIALLFSYNN